MTAQPSRLYRPEPEVFRVLPNPYAAHLDHFGRPSGAVLCDPIDHVPYTTSADGTEKEQRRFVGATLIVEEMTPAKLWNNRVIEPAKHDRGWEYTHEPVTVPATQYYIQHIMTGDLVAADVDTWVLAGGSRETFRPPMLIIAEQKAHKVGHHEREYGKSKVPEQTHKHWEEHLGPAMAEHKAKRAAAIAKAEAEHKAAEDAKAAAAKASADEKQKAIDALQLPTTSPSGDGNPQEGV